MHSTTYSTRSWTLKHKRGWRDNEHHKHPAQEQAQGETKTVSAREELRKIEKCINNECFRWAVGLCMDIKKDYWHSYLECLSVHATRPDLVPTLDKYHERALNEAMVKYTFLSRDAIMECLIV